MHASGKEYRDTIQQMYFLEDDMDDESIHFSAAMERMKINNGYVEGKIAKMKEKLQDSKIHEYESYIFKGS